MMYVEYGVVDMAGIVIVVLRGDNRVTGVVAMM